MSDERTAKAREFYERHVNTHGNNPYWTHETVTDFAESERSSAIKEARADIRTQLLEVTAKVARGVYMPDIYNCRNIREARAVIERADALRVGLTFELNKILKLLDGGEW